MEITKKLIGIFSTLKPEVSFAPSDELIESGLIDSFDLILIVAEIEKEFNIAIPGEMILPEFFSSVESIANLILKLK